MQELKFQNIRNVVEATRAELADYWDKCFYGDEQRRAFYPYYEGEQVDPSPAVAARYRLIDCGLFLLGILFSPSSQMTLLKSCCSSMKRKFPG